MMLRKDWDDLDENGKTGDWCFMDDIKHGLIIIIRFGENAMTDVAALHLDKTKMPAKYPVWDWDGNKEAPTLSPSILVHGASGQADKWHGYLRAGKLENA